MPEAADARENRTPLVEVVGITKKYGGVTALDDVSLKLLAGEVHCLAGENGSGKSTLIKIMSGVETPTSGLLRINGAEHSALTPREAVKAGIDVIFQDLALFPTLTVAENIALPAELTRGRRTVSHTQMRRRAREVVDRLNVRLDLDRRVEELSVADRQLTAICRSMARQARVVFMDEPTTALTQREVGFLFKAVAELLKRGVSIVFVSHKLEEVRQISERITVLRNGRVVAEGRMADFDAARISREMTGRDLAVMTPTATVRADSAPVLRAEGLGRTGAFTDVTFQVRPGEILGITGLLGSGQSDIAEAIFGMRPADAGRLQVDGQDVTIGSVRDALAHGIGYVPGDRLTQGLFVEQSISDNLVIGAVTENVDRLGLLDRGAIRGLEESSIASLSIKTPSAAAPVSSLSGGNQQRVVLARWLARNPRVLILNSPTVGVDVGSKAGILDVLRARAGDGMAVLLISDDPTEVVAVCHRVLFVKRGRISKELAGSELSVDTINKELAA